jgi:tetratricopeptide (TPR) repeat protein
MGETVDQARRAVLKLIEEGLFGDAAELGRQSLEQFEDDSELTMLRGLALVQAGEIDEGTALLKLSTELGPTNPETFHNLAVALCNQGDFAEAQTIAKEALRLDPSHEGAVGTLRQCQAQFEISTENAGRKLIDPSEESNRPGLDSAEVHVLHLGEAWTRVGFGVCAFCVFSFIYILYHPILGGSGTSFALRPDPASKLSFFLYVTSGLAAVFWTLIDIIDRREKFVWLLPVWICGFVAMPVLPLTFYLALRKKMVQMR